MVKTTCTLTGNGLLINHGTGVFPVAATDDLDECHGLVSEVMVDGKKKITYHYVMTQDFPFSAGCFRAKPVSYMVIGNGQGGAPAQQGQNNRAGGSRQPPTEAYTACSGKAKNEACSINVPQGSVSGHCDMPPGISSLVCIP